MRFILVMGFSLKMQSSLNDARRAELSGWDLLLMLWKVIPVSRIMNSGCYVATHWIPQKLYYRTSSGLGDKTKARDTAIAAGLPVIPGSDSTVTVDEAKSFVKEYGLPVMLKAVHGGGGRGMRVVRSEEELEDSFKVQFHKRFRGVLQKSMGT